MNKVILVFVASVAFLFFILQQWVGLAEISATLLSVNIIYLPIIIALPLLALCVYSLRWRLLLSGVGIDVDFKVVLKYSFIGAAFNNITPMVRFGGEPIKAYLLSREVTAEKKNVLASITMDSYITAITLVVLVYFGAVSLAFFNILNWMVSSIIMLFLLFPLLFGVYLLYDIRLLVLIGKRLARLIRRFSPNAGQGLEDELAVYRESIRESMKKKGIVLKALGLGAIERFLEILCLFTVFLALGVDLSFFASAMVLGVGILAGLIPLFPGGLVTYESFTIMTLGLLATPTVLATTSIILWRFVSFWVITFIGLLTGWLLGVKFAFKKQ